MSLATFIAFALFLFSLVLTRPLFKKQIFNPLVVFFGVWSLALWLFELNGTLNLFAISISDKGTILLTLGFFAFFIGGVTVPLAYRTVSTVKEIQINDSAIMYLYRSTAVCIMIMAVGVFWRFSDVIAIFGNPFSNLGDIRSQGVSGEFELATTGRILTLFGYLAALNVGTLIVLRKNRLNFLLVAAILLLFYLNDVTLGARGSTVNAAILLISSFLIAKTVSASGLKLADLAQGIGIFAIGIASITTILFLRGGDAERVPYQDRLTTDNYIYLVGTLPATSAFFDEPWPSTLPGQWTFAGLYQAVDLIAKNVVSVEIIKPNTYQSSYAPILYVGPFNSSSFLTYFYSDFRELGLMLLSFILGLISALTFIIAANKRRLVDIQLAALMMFVVIFTIRGMPTNGIMFWTTLGFIILQAATLKYLSVKKMEVAIA